MRALVIYAFGTSGHVIRVPTHDFERSCTFLSVKLQFLVVLLCFVLDEATVTFMTFRSPLLTCCY